MTISSAQRRRGWYAFDWASQPFHTLIVTFIFSPYFVNVVGDPVDAQKSWASAMALAGLVIALTAPVIGTLADQSGRLIRWVAGLSLLYVSANSALWFAAPDSALLWPILMTVGLGMIATELATSVTNAFLPSLGSRDEIGRISGNGFAIGYLGGLIALVFMLAFFAQGADGTTFLGLPLPFGLSAETYEGTRFVGPFTALWFAVFMIPFFLWVKDPVRDAPDMSLRQAIHVAWRDVRGMYRRAMGRRSLRAFLLSSMFFRDALNGLFAFGGIYTVGVLGWSVTQVGLFGLLGGVCSGGASWLGGRADTRFGPKPIISGSIVILTLVCILILTMDRTAVLGMPLPEGSALPDILMYVCGALIGATGAVLQSCSRTMMVHHTDPEHPTESFGMFALSGKATAFLAPALIGLTTDLTGDQRLGISPLIALFLLGLLLLVWVNKDGDI